MGQLGRFGVLALNAVLVLACAFLAATAVSSVLAEWADPPVAALETASAPEVARAHTWEDRQVILDRNLFQASTVTPPPEPVVEELEETKLPVKLLGTAVAAELGLSVAAIMDEQKRDHVVVRIGDRVADKATVVRIEQRRVVLRNGSRLEELLLADASESVTTRSASSAAAAARSARLRARTQRTAVRRGRETDAETSAEVGERIRRLSQNRFSVPRSDVASAANDPTALFSQARILPRYEENGEMIGVQLSAIQDGSLFQRIGISNGDTVREVNGIQISSPEESAKLLRELSEASEFNVIVRGADGTERTLTYELEDE